MYRLGQQGGSQPAAQQALLFCVTARFVQP